MRKLEPHYLFYHGYFEKTPNIGKIRTLGCNPEPYMRKLPNTPRISLALSVQNHELDIGNGECMTYDKDSQYTSNLP